MSEKPTKNALVALSADPWTHGHSRMVSLAQTKDDFAKVVIGIANNGAKKYTFAQWERLRLAQASNPGVDPKDIVLVPGSVAHYMMKQNIQVLIRGVRNAIDEATEETMRFYNLREMPEMEILRIETPNDDDCAEISSSGVKEVLKVNHDISSFVCSKVKEALESRLLSQHFIGITGEMGSGKSTLATAIAETTRGYHLPCTVVEFDTIAHDIYTSLHDPIYVITRQKIADLYGAEILNSDGTIDRKKLGILFRDHPEKKEKFDDILRRPSLLRFQDLIRGKTGLIIVDAALLVEFNLTHLSNHHTVIVDAARDVRLKRVQNRYAERGVQMSDEDINQMFDMQMPNSKKLTELRERIQKEKNGSVRICDTTQNKPDPRKELFRILNQVDTFGELRTHFILKQLGLGESEISGMISEIKKIHEQPHRFYHTWEHIIEMLSHLFEYAANHEISDEEISTLGAAILFHDSVYEVHKIYYKDNETRSASLFMEKLGTKLAAGTCKNLIPRIYSIITDTAHGVAEVNRLNKLSCLMHDFDLAILGSSPERYAQYVHDIMTELGIYTDKEFRLKRAELLEKFLANPDLFVTEYGKARFQKEATENITREIASLRAI